MRWEKVHFFLFVFAIREKSEDKNLLSYLVGKRKTKIFRSFCYVIITLLLEKKYHLFPSNTFQLN